MEMASSICSSAATRELGSCNTLQHALPAPPLTGTPLALKLQVGCGSSCLSLQTNQHFKLRPIHS